VHGQLPRSRRRHGEGPGDARVARRPVQHPAEAAGELRARADGAVQHGVRFYTESEPSTPRPASSPVEPAAHDHSAETCPRSTSSSTRRQPRTAATAFTFPIYPTAAGPFRPDRRGTACRTASTITAVAGNRGNGAPAGDALWNYFVSEINPPRELVDDLAGAVPCRAGYNIRAVMAAAAAVGRLPVRGEPFTKYSCRPSSWRVASRNGLERLHGERRRQQMVNMARCSRAARRGRLEQGPDGSRTGGMLARMNFAAQLSRTQARTWSAV